MLLIRKVVDSVKIKSFILGGLVCYIFCFFIYFGVFLFNGNVNTGFLQVSDSYYEFADELDTRFDKLSQYNLSDRDSSCLGSLKEFKEFSNNTSKIGSVSHKEISKIYSENNKSQRLAMLGQNCISENYNDYKIISKYYNIMYFYDSIYKMRYSDYKFIFSDVDGGLKNYYYSSMQYTELELVSDILDLMEGKYE